jgi:hypothetical protein
MRAEIDILVIIVSQELANETKLVGAEKMILPFVGTILRGYAEELAWLLSPDVSD